MLSRHATERFHSVVCLDCWKLDKDMFVNGNTYSIWRVSSDRASELESMKTFCSFCEKMSNIGQILICLFRWEFELFLYSQLYISSPLAELLLEMSDGKEAGSRRKTRREKLTEFYKGLSSRSYSFFPVPGISPYYPYLWSSENRAFEPIECNLLRGWTETTERGRMKKWNETKTEPKHQNN